MYFDTRKNAKTFVGLEGKDGKVHPGSALFILKGDDKELYNSGIVKFGDAPKTIDIPLNGIKILDLIVEPTDDGPSGDHPLDRLHELSRERAGSIIWYGEEIT